MPPKIVLIDMDSGKFTETTMEEIEDKSLSDIMDESEEEE